MAEPDNIVPEHLRAIRTQLDDLQREVASKAEAAHVAALERKLDGLTHVMISSFGSIISRPDSIDARMSRMEHEHA